MTDLRNVIEARQVTIGYDKEIIVPDIQCCLAAGQSQALVGMNGSGKSTYLKTLAGLLPLLSGELKVLEKAPGKSPAQVAFLSQARSNHFILPLRVIDTVQMGRFAIHGLLDPMTDKDEAIVIDSLKRMEILAIKDKPLRSLSGGQQQRVFIAQLLAKQASILLLDEPTTSLDAVGIELYYQMIQDEIAKGHTIVIATHSIHEAKTCSHTMLLARKVIACGPSEEVLTSENLMETFGRVFEHE